MSDRLTDAQLLAAAHLHGLVLHVHDRVITRDDVAEMDAKIRELEETYGDDRAGFARAYVEWCRDSGY